MPLSIQHQADSAGDKAVSLIADNSGSNVAAAFKGVNKATQNGDTVADLVVSLDGEAIATGATDDAAAAGAIFPVAGLYQSTVDEVDAGDVGRVRMSARRGVINTPDWRTIELTPGTPTPSGSDITSLNSAALASTDFTIRDTSGHYIIIPMAGYREIAIGIDNESTGWDQTVTLSVFAAMRQASTFGQAHAAKIGQFALPTASSAGFCIGQQAGGVGAIVGADPAVTSAYFSIPALAAGAFVFLQLAASVSPTTGGIRRMTVHRRG